MPALITNIEHWSNDVINVCFLPHPKELSAHRELKIKCCLLIFHPPVKYMAEFNVKS